MVKVTRPTREQRGQNRLKESKLSRVDKSGRTRAGKKALTEVALMEGLSEKEVKAALKKQILKSKIPTKIMPGSKKIYSGKSRSFEKKFSDKYWKDNSDAKCFKCGIELTAKNRSIDHKVPWSTYCLETDQLLVCSGGTHYEVAKYEDYLDRFQDLKNLQPACKTCNSSKGGTKGNDGIAPRKLLLKDQTCEGSGCKLPKAV